MVPAGFLTSFPVEYARHGCSTPRLVLKSMDMFRDCWDCNELGLLPQAHQHLFALSCKHVLGSDWSAEIDVSWSGLQAGIRIAGLCP